MASSLVPPSLSMIKSGVINANLFTNREVVNSHDKAIENDGRRRQDHVMPSRSKDIGLRLKTLRQSLGMKAIDLATSVECKANRWSQYESGERTITLEVAIRVADEYGVTLDWIYRGDRASLSQEMRVKVPRVA